MQDLQIEQNLFYLAGLFYFILAINLVVDRNYHKSTRLPLVLLFTGLVLHTLSIAVRWQRTGHGPFINLYEILTSNIWSLFLGLALFIIFFPKRRGIVKLVLPVIAVLMLWLLAVDPGDTYLPPTYNTVWLYFHVISGKVFFTLLLISTGFAVNGLYSNASSADLSTSPQQKSAELKLSYSFLTMALVFDSFMLFFGAIWAQDAWGRYWAWDPLETWAFLTWLSIVFTLHLMPAFKSEKVFYILIIVCFVLAFLTFFGVPFFSTAAHQGMV